MNLKRTQEPFFLIAGPCVIESEAVVLTCAHALKALSDKLGMDVIFKSSLDKANRTSVHSFRGLGQAEGLRILERVKAETGLRTVTDVHRETGMDEIADVVDVLQIPAFLSRQTDLVLQACSYGKPVNIKKGQFMAPGDMVHVVEKAKGTGNPHVMVCERGSSFGYHNLVVDMRSLVLMRQTDCPVVMDVTHSVQLPGGQGGSSGGQRQFIPAMARAAVSVGVDGLFMETHPQPDQALSDGPNSWPLDDMLPLMASLLELDALVKAHPTWMQETGEPHV